MQLEHIVLGMDSQFAARATMELIVISLEAPRALYATLVLLMRITLRVTAIYVLLVLIIVDLEYHIAHYASVGNMAITMV